ncbi:MAG: RNA 2',3'-cyclic phosphodiesterase [Acidobacteria bacterium]|nr:RNA 2',3'-cyclic phosphodiesterase [Acidobacteriota bacterium]MBV9145810.1 RNA 2',3'-cyclic phosphodiesterase [Acidobacteriota bacterium]MBV9436723.1 RNA 2',3'-cyclic phosphodiesterase [Acidobacteriota bacterium]
MRLFVAIEIAADIREELVNYVSQVKPRLTDARWSGSEGLHITLKFLGNVQDEKRTAIEAKLSAVQAARFQVSIAGVGLFPNERSPRVLWAGLTAPPDLSTLADAVEDAMESLGFERERRAYSPHITLARFKDGVSRSALDAALAGAPKNGFGTMAATEFHLYESKPSPQGSRYSKLASFALR